MIHGTIISTLPFSLGWKPGICVRDTRPFPLITAITPAIGYRLLMASSPTRTVLSIFVYGYGKKGGGRNGLHRW